MPRVVAAADLAAYDDTAGTLVDTNVWIACIDTTSPWHDWSTEQLQACSERSPLHINIVIYTELLIPGPDARAERAADRVQEGHAEDVEFSTCHGPSARE